MTIAPPTNWRTRSQRMVWDRRHEFVVERLLAPADALARASESDVRPFIITESADAPTAGATGDGPAMLHTLAGWRSDRTVLATIVDAPSVSACHEAGVGASVSLRVGGSLDPRWGGSVRVDAEVVRVGDGDYTLTGVGYTGITVSMGRFAVVRRGSMQLLLTELAAWSADPGTWRHAGLDPYDDRRPGRSVVHRLHRELPGLGRDRGGRRRARRCDASTDAADVRTLRRRAVPSRSDGHALTAAGNGYDTNAAFCFVADG